MMLLRSDLAELGSLRSISIRGTVLFTIGNFLAIMMNIIQAQKDVQRYTPEVLTSYVTSGWWLPPLVGLASVIIGLLYPCLDKRFNKELDVSGEWPNVMKCVIVFFGISQVCAKIEFSTNLHLFAVLSFLSVGTWWVFDRSSSGLSLAITLSLIATLVTQLCLHFGVYIYKEPDATFRSAIPCLFFSGGITMGNIGRQLALVTNMYETKEHAD